MVKKSASWNPRNAVPTCEGGAEHVMTGVTASNQG